LEFSGERDPPEATTPIPRGFTPPGLFPFEASRLDTGAPETLTMAEYSANQIKNHIEVIDAELAAKRDILPILDKSKNPVDKRVAIEFRQRINYLEQGYLYWSREYQKKTGQALNAPRAKTITQWETEQHEAAAASAKSRHEQIEQERRQNEQQRKYKSAVLSDYQRLKNGLEERRGLLQRLQSYISSNWHVMFMVTIAGGRSWLNLSLIEFTLLKRVDQYLAEAHKHILANKHAHAVPLLETAATILNAAGTELSAFQDSLQSGADRIATTIKVTSAAMTPGVAAGMTTTVGVAAAKATVEHGTGLAAQAMDPKRVVRQRELKAAAQEVLIDGSAAAGEVAKRFLAAPIASLVSRARQPSPQEIERIETIVSEYFSANGKQLVNAITDGRLEYKKLAGLIAPVLKAKSGSFGLIGEAIAEEQVAKDLEALVRGP
jgi:hypothetical protein